MHAFADVQTDHLITQNVKAKIASDPSVSSANILVKTADGVVILNGLVDTQSQKDAALKMAESVQNVLKVESNISVRTVSEKATNGTAQAPSNDQGAAATASMPQKPNTETQQATSPNSTIDSSQPTIPPTPPNPNYNPTPPNYPASGPTTTIPANPTSGTSLNKSP
jgi:hypothetical protein